ncbi:MAG: hypothetical protein WD749_00555 [Phycisphaerales bacterium]
MNAVMVVRSALVAAWLAVAPVVWCCQTGPKEAAPSQKPDLPEQLRSIRPPENLAPTGLTVKQETLLLREYAPVLVWDKSDNSDRIEALVTPSFFVSTANSLSTEAGPVKDFGSVPATGRSKWLLDVGHSDFKSAWLDSPGENGGATRDGAAGNRQASTREAITKRIACVFGLVQDLGKEYWSLQYWVLFAFNNAREHHWHHEGDWLCLEVVAPKGPSNSPPVGLFYHNHGEVLEVMPEAARFSDKKRMHAIAFLEGGTNEPWPLPGGDGDGHETVKGLFRTGDLGHGGLGALLTIRSHRGDAADAGYSVGLESLLVNVRDDSSIDARLVMSFPGRWGGTGAQGHGSPVSPMFNPKMRLRRFGEHWIGPAERPTFAVLNVPSGLFDELGERIAQEARDRIRKEIGKAGGTAFDVLDLGIVEGTKKPEAYFGYGGSTGIDAGNGRGAVALDFVLRARVKVDTLGGPLTTKVAEVGVWQLVRVSLVPTANEGRISFAESRADVIHEAVEKGGKAKQAHLEELRKQVKSSFIDTLNEHVKQLDSLLPEEVKNAPFVAQLRVVRRPRSKPADAQREVDASLPQEVRGGLGKIGFNANDYAAAETDLEVELRAGSSFTGGATLAEGAKQPSKPLYIWGDTRQGAGPGPRQFYMPAVDLGDSITGIVPFTGRCCDNFLFVVRSRGGKETYAPATPDEMLGKDEHRKGFNNQIGGQDYQKQTVIKLRSNEYITGYQIRYGNKTDSIRFILNSGRSEGVPKGDKGRGGLLIGGPGGHRYSPEYEAPAGYELVGLKIQGAGDTVDSIRGVFRLREPLK